MTHSHPVGPLPPQEPRQLLLPDRDGAETLGIRRDHALVTRELAMLLGREPRNLRGALAYIEAHLAEPMTLGVIARAAGCSARTLNDTFREHFSVSPMTRVRQLRLDRARADLLDGAASVTDVACRWGFTHLGRFSGASLVEVRVAGRIHLVLADRHRRLHDELAPLVAALGIPGERLLEVLGGAQAVREDRAVLDPLRRALTHVRGHGVHRVADQHDPAAARGTIVMSH